MISKSIAMFVAVINLKRKKLKSKAKCHRNYSVLPSVKARFFLFGFRRLKIVIGLTFRFFVVKEYQLQNYIF